MNEFHLINIEILVTLCGASILVYYIYNRYFSDIKLFVKPKTNEELQSEYIEKKDKSVILSVKEKLEISWKFLYDLTEVIVQKFPDADKQKIIETGGRLFNLGMRYEHVIDDAVNYIKQKSHEKTLATSKESEVKEQKGQSR